MKGSGTPATAMTLKVELEDRQEAASIEVSKKEFVRTVERQGTFHASPAARTTPAVAAPFSAKQIYLTASVYAALLVGGIWATLNVLSWFWRKLLQA